MFKEILIAGCGGFIGTAGRFMLSRLAAYLWHGAFPLGTFAVNVIGCFLFGLFFGLLENTRVMAQEANTLLLVGFCGGFTTFSTFAADLRALAQRGDWAVCAAYFAVSIAAGIACLIAGRALAR